MNENAVNTVLTLSVVAIACIAKYYMNKKTAALRAETLAYRKEVALQMEKNINQVEQSIIAKNGGCIAKQRIQDARASLYNFMMTGRDCNIERIARHLTNAQIFT